MDVNRRKKESLHYPLFMVEALTKLLYQWEFKVGRIILVVLFLGFLALWQREERGRWGRRNSQANWAKVGSVFHTHFPDFNGKLWCVRIGTMEVFDHCLCIGKFLYRNLFVFFTWEIFPMDKVMNYVSNTLRVNDIFHFSFFNTRYNLRRVVVLVSERGNHPGDKDEASIHGTLCGSDATICLT